MIKPTPTPLPPATPHFTIPSSYSLWASTDYAVQSWNLFGDGRAAIQIVILITLILAGAFLLTKFLKNMTRRDSEL